jgi:hypothetical protein
VAIVGTIHSYVLYITLPNELYEKKKKSQVDFELEWNGIVEFGRERQLDFELESRKATE